MIAATITLFTASAAQAYIGPGAGIAFVGSLLTVILVTILSLFALLILPFRILFRRFAAARKKRADKKMQ
ncbi:hypothetical protein [Mesorhizobium caraganae]|uniref:hypothetical protein n=1 Tax=Mesorhizobium caraganae TaxID=483206 RepID=UPI003ED10EA2